MKKIVVLLILIVVLINCQDSREDEKSSVFSKHVGQEIPIEVAERWAIRYKQSNQTSRNAVQSLDASTLDQLLSPIDNKLGVVLHHALDSEGISHVLVIPIKDDNILWNTSDVMDTNGEIISTSIAKQWVENFKIENASSIWSHFFGIDLFEQILADEKFQRIEFIHGIDDSSSPQLMLYVWRVSDGTNGKAKTEELSVYDKSTTCPTHCAEY